MAAHGMSSMRAVWACSGSYGIGMGEGRLLMSTIADSASTAGRAATAQQTMDAAPASRNITPANRTCGTSTIGMSDIALSGVDAIADSARPSVMPANPESSTVM